MSMVQQAIEVSAPLHTVYEQLAAFENYPRFMSGVREVTPIGDDRTHWIIDVDGKCREFDAQIIERSVDERVSWSTMEGPLLAETLTLRPLGETRTQVVAQLEADLAFLMPSGRHGQASLTRRLKEDLATFKSLVESGVLGGGAKPAGGPAHKATTAQTSSKRPSAGASADQLSDRSTKIFGGGAPDPASVAARINPHPGASWGSSAAELSNSGRAELGHPGHTDADSDSDVDKERPGRRIVKSGRVSGGVAGTAPMGGRTARKDIWGDGMINEEDRGSAADM